MSDSSRPAAASATSVRRVSVRRRPLRRRRAVGEGSELSEFLQITHDDPLDQVTVRRTMRDESHRDVNLRRAGKAASRGLRRYRLLRRGRATGSPASQASRGRPVTDPAGRGQQDIAEDPLQVVVVPPGAQRAAQGHGCLGELPGEDTGEAEVDVPCVVGHL